MTFQVRERLIYKGQEVSIACLPLSSYRGPAQPPEFGIVSSACWRGYVGTWQVLDDVLHLTRLDPPTGQADREALHEMFPEHPGPVPATWFSGEISPEAWRESGPLFSLVFRGGLLLLEETLDRDGSVCGARLTLHCEGLFPAQELAFFQAIWASRADPAPRLVYADWLEERDDPRAALVREEAQLVQHQGPARRLLQPFFREDIPGGNADAGARDWFWGRLADLRKP